MLLSFRGRRRPHLHMDQHRYKPRQPPRGVTTSSNRRGGSTPTTPVDARGNAAPSTPAPTGPGPHGQLVFTHPGAVATWGQSAHALDELQLGGAAVVLGSCPGGTAPRATLACRRRPTTPTDARPSGREPGATSGQEMGAGAPRGGLGGMIAAGTARLARCSAVVTGRRSCGRDEPPPVRWGPASQHLLVSTRVPPLPHYKCSRLPPALAGCLPY